MDVSLRYFRAQVRLFHCWKSLAPRPSSSCSHRNIVGILTMVVCLGDGDGLRNEPSSQVD